MFFNVVRHMGYAIMICMFICICSMHNVHVFQYSMSDVLSQAFITLASDIKQKMENQPAVSKLIISITSYTKVLLYVM